MAVTFYAGQRLRASDLQGIIDDHLRVVKAANTIRNNVGTLADDPELTLPLKANYTYIVRVVAFFLTAATPDIQWALRLPTSATTPFGALRMVTTSAGLVGDVDPGAYSSATSASSNLAAGGTGLASTALLEATVKMSTTDGNLVLMWAQLVANVSDTTLYIGTSMSAERIH